MVQDAAWAQAVRAARLSAAAPRRRPPTEMISLHTQPDALLPPNLAQYTPRQHSVGPMLDPPSGNAEHAALKWIDAAARPLNPNPNPYPEPEPEPKRQP